jgi:hypothetical protein
MYFVASPIYMPPLRLSQSKFHDPKNTLCSFVEIMKFVFRISCAKRCVTEGEHCFQISVGLPYTLQLSFSIFLISSSEFFHVYYSCLFVASQPCHCNVGLIFTHFGNIWHTHIFKYTPLDSITCHQFGTSLHWPVDF